MAARKSSRANRKYKVSRNRRDWRKLHIGVDDEGFIVAAKLTASGGDDARAIRK